MTIAGLILMGIGFFLLVLGIVFLGLGGRNNRTVQVEGKIVDMCYNSYMYNQGGSGNVKALISSGSQCATSSCPVFEYKVNGVTYKRAGKIAYNRRRLMRIMGQPCMVYYNPDAPEDASLSDKSPLSVIGIIFSLLGVVLLLLGIIFFIIKH